MSHHGTIYCILMSVSSQWSLCYGYDKVDINFLLWSEKSGSTEMIWNCKIIKVQPIYLTVVKALMAIYRYFFD